ncbi:hypothetical protein E2C01_002008 [Portunus trituberculatus]|uniref:Uncharacterized protein n=1 Tax=Portunus trituberculatus TaxID=210409 RepID=A0A5B7CIM7_PORTR|nr:hypothetical protein [Portunus trituberculatus]
MRIALSCSVPPGDRHISFIPVYSYITPQCVASCDVTPSACRDGVGRIARWGWGGLEGGG